MAEPAHSQSSLRLYRLLLRFQNRLDDRIEVLLAMMTTKVMTMVRGEGVMEPYRTLTLQGGGGDGKEKRRITDENNLTTRRPCCSIKSA